MTEIWRPVKGQEQKYEVSNFGNVRRCPYIAANGRRFPLRKIKTYVDRSNYVIANLWINNTNSIRYVHRMVAEAFCEMPNHLISEKHICVNHLNGNKIDNTSINLEWTTYKENSAHAIKTGLHAPSAFLSNGDPIARKVTPEMKNKIKEFIIANKPIKYISKNLDISLSSAYFYAKQINMQVSNLA